MFGVNNRPGAEMQLRKTRLPQEISTGFDAGTAPWGICRSARDGGPSDPEPRARQQPDAWQQTLTGGQLSGHSGMSRSPARLLHCWTTPHTDGNRSTHASRHWPR